MRLLDNSHEPIGLSMALHRIQQCFYWCQSTFTSHRLNANYDQVFVVTDNAILFSLQTRIYLDCSIYNGSGQSPWLYMIIYNPDLGLTIAIVDWKQQGCFQGATERAGVTTKGAG